jgi:Outer membrane protein beta-barrel domain
MLKLWIAAAVAVAFAALGAAPAMAQDWYVKAQAGTTVDVQVEGVELGDGPTYGVYVGRTFDLSIPLRVEAGVEHSEASASFGGFEIDGSANIYNATAYLDSSMGVYAGLGVDFADAELNVFPIVTANTDGWGFHGTVGYAHDLGPGVAEVQYTYRDLDTDVDITGGAVTIGYRVPFGA